MADQRFDLLSQIQSFICDHSGGSGTISSPKSSTNEAAQVPEPSLNQEYVVLKKEDIARLHAMLPHLPPKVYIFKSIRSCPNCCALSMVP